MFEKVTCSKCKKTYDGALEECPVCHEENKEQPNEFKKIQMLNYVKQLALFLTGWLGLKIFAYLFSYIASKVVYDYETSALIRYYRTSVRTHMMVNTAVYLIVGLILALILFTDIKKLLKTFKGATPYIAGAVCFASMIAFNIFYNIILNATGAVVSNNTNEAGLLSVTQVFPIISLFIFGIIGPIVEEITYRVGLFSVSKRISKWVAYPITIVFFTLIHFDFEASSMTNELLNIPFYAFAAFALTFTYDHYGFSASLTAHVINNVFSLAFVSFISCGVIL